MRSKPVLEADGSRKRGRELKGDDSASSADSDAMYFSMGSRIVQARQDIRKSVTQISTGLDSTGVIIRPSRRPIDRLRESSL